MKLIYILVFLSLGNAPYIKRDKVCWNKIKPISWQNYRGKPCSRLPFDAFTTIAISYNIISRDKVSLENCIVESKSWVKKSRQTPSLLKHEQYHFHLAEVIVRKMRMEISHVSNPTISAIQTIYDKWMLEYKRVQIQYDEDTNHSKNEIEQERWQGKIDQELIDLILFQDEIVTLSNH